MPEYTPTLTWKVRDRKVKARCADCGWYRTIALQHAIRAHVTEHPAHVVIVVATMTTAVMMPRPPLKGVRNDSAPVQGHALV
jgi:hypothetical protein